MKSPGLPLRVALLATMLGLSWHANAATLFVTTTADAGAGSLRAALTSAGNGDTIVFQTGGTITLASELPVITKNLTIDGNGNNPVISGAGTYRPFFIGDAGTTGSTYSVTIANLSIANAAAQGGSGIDGGGGGAGLGGAVFVSSNGALTLSNVSLSNNHASGGAGGAFTNNLSGGGGGMGGNGGSSPSSAGNGGGGLAVGSNSVSGLGTSGGGANGGSGTMNAGTGGSGGLGGGGGGSNATLTSGDSQGGSGGFGGGGGGGFTISGQGTGGAGGYGGGGGGAYSGVSAVGGNGGFGGGGAAVYSATRTAGTGGFGAGAADVSLSVPLAAGGGGGLGAGGAVYVQTGGTVTVSGSLIVNGNSVAGGSGGGGYGASGSAYGSGIFFQGTSGTTTTLAFGAGSQSIADTIADYIGSGGTNPAGGTNAADQGGSVALTKSGGGTLALAGPNTYSGGTTINEGSTLVIGNGSALGSGALTLNGGATGVTVNFNGSFSVANNITATGDPTYNVLTGNTVDLSGVLSGSGDVVVNNQSGYAGTLVLSGVNTYTGPTVVDAGTLQAGSTSAFGNNSAMTVASGAILDLAGFSNAVGSLAGAGTVTNSGVAAVLTAGGNNASTVFSGTIGDGTGPIALTKTGSGLLVLGGVNSYSGVTLVGGGELRVNGSIASSSSTTILSGAILSGSGTLGNTLIQSGAIFAPGSGTPGSAMTIAGNLAFQSGAVYLVQLNPTATTGAIVNGSATLAGSVIASFASGTYLTRSYSILHATSISGSFAAFSTVALPAGFNVDLQTTTTDVLINLTAQLGALSSGGLNRNQRNVADALNGFFNGGGALPPGFVAVFGLTGAPLAGALTQLSGETATGAQQTTFDAMDQFLGVLTDSFVDGRGSRGADTDGAMGYAAAAGKRSGAEREAYGMMTKTPSRTGFDPRWRVWAAGFGGTQTTDGNAAIGSNTATSRIAGTAVGADVWLSPRTVAGVALAGGGTSFNVANGGGGRSDLFQAGAFMRHTAGPAFVTAALAYGWQEVTTDRTISVAGSDRLQARFNANAFSGRAEAGYRFATPWLGVTPYAAAQVTAFDLPAYAEQVLAGSGTFALSYVAKTATATRSEIGLRTDRSFLINEAVMTVRGRAAWAHEYGIDRSIVATFQTLPGASLVVGGASPGPDAALATASAEIAWRNGFSIAASFEGAFSHVVRSYAGKGVIRYAW